MEKVIWREPGRREVREGIHFTDVEIRYILLVMDGVRNKEIAETLHVTEISARNSVLRLAQQVGVSGAYGLSSWANQPLRREYFKGDLRREYREQQAKKGGVSVLSTRIKIKPVLVITHAHGCPCAECREAA